MIILFVDDEDYRHQSADKAFNGSKHIILHAYNEDTALAMLKKYKVDLIMLDHDLGWNQPTGSDIASAMINKYYNKLPKKVIAHTSNFQGGLNIVSKFQSADIHSVYRPWSYDLCKNLREELEE